MSETVAAVGSFTHDRELHVIGYQGKTYRLTVRESDILSVFLARPGAVVTRDTLKELVWKLKYVERSNIDAGVSRLRARMTELDPAVGACLETVKGEGYRYKPLTS